MNNMTQQLCYVALITVSATAGDINTIHVGQNETMTESDLVNGEFLGQHFDLGPLTSFQINSGGILGPLESTSPESPFDFMGSTIDLNPGGGFSPLFTLTQSYLTNLTFNLHESGIAYAVHALGNQSIINVQGGTYIGTVDQGVTVNLSSGALSQGFQALNGSTVHATGGTLYSARFASGSSIYATNSMIRSGLIATDGSVAVLENTNVGNDSIIQNSSLTMFNGSMGDETYFQGSQTTLNNVSVGNDSRALGGNLQLVNSSIGESFIIDRQSNVELVNSHIGDNVTVYDWVGLDDAGTLTVHSGSVGDNLTIYRSGTVNIYGGEIGSEIEALSYSRINLFVTALYLNNTLIEHEPSDTIELSMRDGTLLEAVLSDGSFFDLLLDDQFIIGQDRVDDSAIVTVTFVPAPSTLLLLGSLSLFGSRQRRA